MRFQQFAPPAPLRPYVRYFWTLHSEPAGVGQQAFRTIADGCPGLICQHSAAGGLRDQHAKPWPTLLLYGQSTRPGAVVADGPFQMAGACLQPGALLPVFGVRADELTDQCLDLAALATAPRHLTAPLLDPAAPAPVDQLAALLLAGARRHAGRADAGMHYALTQLAASRGQASLPRLQEQVGLSERSFQRRFKHYAGVPPQLFARICLPLPGFPGPAAHRPVREVLRPGV